MGKVQAQIAPSILPPAPEFRMHGDLGEHLEALLLQLEAAEVAVLQRQVHVESAQQALDERRAVLLLDREIPLNAETGKPYTADQRDAWIERESAVQILALQDAKTALRGRAVRRDLVRQRLTTLRAFMAAALQPVPVLDPAGLLAIDP